MRRQTGFMPVSYTHLDVYKRQFLQRCATEDHYEFYWFPHTNCALTKTNTRLPADTPADGPGKVRRYIDDEFLSNGCLLYTSRCV